jgi:antitoxin (DNA-binding transcriptional repressor) of toxin-antitoxin stability system
MAMTEVTLTEAQQRLPDLLAAAAAGEPVVIRPPAGLPVRLVPIPTPSGEESRPATGFGCCRGMIWMAEDFDAPLEELQDYMR